MSLLCPSKIHHLIFHTSPAPECEMFAFKVFTLLILGSASFCNALSNECERLQNYRLNDSGEYDLLKTDIPKLMNACENMNTKRQFYTDLFASLARESLEFYLKGVCNHFPDLYLDLQSGIPGKKQDIFSGLLDKWKFSPKEQVNLTFLLRSCHLDLAREKLLPVLCPLFVEKFDHLDPGFAFTCIRSNYVNRTALIQRILHRASNDSNVSSYFSQITHEILHHFSNFNLLHPKECTIIVKKILSFYSGLYSDLKACKFKCSIYEKLVKSSQFTPQMAYFVDRAKFYIIFTHLFSNDPSDELRREISSYPEGIAFFKAHDPEFEIQHSTLGEYQEAFFQFIQLMPQFRTPDTFMIIVALYEIWDKGGAKPEAKSFTLDQVSDYLKKFISIKHGRPDDDVVFDQIFQLPINNAHSSPEFVFFRERLQSFFATTRESAIEGEESAFYNCFLTKPDNIDLILDWLHDKYTSKTYPFDRAFAERIFQILSRVPSLMRHVILGKKKYLSYFSPHFLDNRTFELFVSSSSSSSSLDDEKQHQQQLNVNWHDLYLFQWLIQTGQVNSQKNEILSYFFQEVESCGVTLQKTNSMKGIGILLEEDLIYGYSDLPKLDNLNVFLEFFNSLPDELFIMLFDVVFVRKSSPKIISDKLFSRINSNSMIDSGLFTEDEAKSLTIASWKSPTFQFTAELKNKISAYLTCFCAKSSDFTSPRDSVFGPGEIIGPADIERLDVILHRIHFSDLPVDSSLRIEAEEFSQRLWRLFQGQKMRNMLFLSALSTINRWADRMAIENLPNFSSFINTEYLRLKDAFISAQTGKNKKKKKVK